MRRFAEDTTIGIGKTRGEIDDLLRAWGCHNIGWSEDYEKGIVTLVFLWRRKVKGQDPIEYAAKFIVRLPDQATLREAAKDRWGYFRQPALDKLMQGRGKQEHRVLLLWLKAALNAVECGIIDADVIFLPFLVGGNGQTVAEAIVPRMRELKEGSALRLLGSGPVDAEIVA